MRGVHGVLSSLALLAGAGTQRDAFLELRDVLLPEGLEGTQKSYRAEAGAADLLRTRLAAEPAAKKHLKEIPVLKLSALHFVEQWMASAKRLGELEDERGKLAGAPSNGNGTQAVAARNQWIRAVNALVANAELAELDEETDRLLFGALRLAEKAADRRGRASAGGNGEDASAAPAATTTAAKPG
jgi:hypothetical protein